MSYAKTDPPSLDQIHAECEQIKEENVINKHAVAEAQTRIANTQKIFVHSLDQIAKSQNLLRRLWLKAKTANLII